MSKKKWRTLASEHVVDSPMLRIRKETVELPNGEIAKEYFINESKGWVAIFCVTKEGTIVVNRQYKHGIGKYVLELPAGGLDPGEAPLTCAKRELLEETGYVANRFRLVRSFIVDPTASEAIMHLYYCDGARRQERPQENPMERITSREVSLSELLDLLRAGKINVMGHVAAIYTVLDDMGLIKLAPRTLKDVPAEPQS